MGLKCSRSVFIYYTYHYQSSISLIFFVINSHKNILLLSKQIIFWFFTAVKKLNFSQTANRTACVRIGIVMREGFRVVARA